MNPHIPKGASTLGLGVSMDSQIFKDQLQGSKFIGLKSYLYHWKYTKKKMFKMASHDPFGHLKHKLWPKERLRVLLTVWFPTIKNQESTWFPCVQVAWNISLEISWRGLQLCFRPHFNWRFACKIMGLQSWESSSARILGLPFGSPGTKGHLDLGLVERHKVYYMGEGGDFLQVWAVVSIMSPSLLMVCPSTKSVPIMH